jgi:hypothetical protein
LRGPSGDCGRRRETEISSLRRQGDAFSDFGGLGFPSGLSQKFPVAMEARLLAAANETRADQKLVCSTDFPCGKSRIKRPSSSLLQNPPDTAFEVQTYVFCYVR